MLCIQVEKHFGTKLYDVCKHLDTEGVGSMTSGHLRKLFFGDYTAPEEAETKVFLYTRTNKEINLVKDCDSVMVLFSHTFL